MCRKSVYLICSFALVLSLMGSAMGQTGTGLRAEYYEWSGSAPPSRANAFRDLVVVRIDPQIYMYWNPGFQATHPDGLKPDFTIPPPEGLRADTFSVRWLGEIEALKSEAYTFITGADDGVRMWLNGELLIDDWADHDRTETTSDPVELVAGQRYPIVVEGYENGGEAEWELYWQSTSMQREVVPQNVLYPLLKDQDYPASKPIPGDGEVIRDTWVSLQWTAGPEAVSHDIYLGDDADQVKAGTGDTFRANQAGTNFVVGFPGFPYPDGLVPGTTYYWRIDEVNPDNSDSPWKGAVWSFSVAPVT
ncbi:MAG: PA14 domain-containing protein, partial [Sedimentisphaerales bacterium]